jgi:hypothetical protein
MQPRVMKAVTVFLLAASWACAPAIKSTAVAPLSPADLSAFWQDVDPRSRDLLHGVGGRQVHPDPEVIYDAIGKDTGGFSVSYDARDPSGVEWSVKIGEEAQSEVTASRLVWAMGYHQPPVSYLPRWRVREGDQGAIRTVEGGRFRPKLPTFDNAEIWSWYQNPFVGTQAYRGLLVLMMILNSTDLKDDNNALYERREGERVVARWYVVKDLGATLGTTGRLYPKRNDIGEFERHGFIEKVENGRVRFAYRGRHQELLRNLAPADVAWMCQRLQRLTPRQWQDAFRAGGYDEATAARYIRKIDQKVAEGLALAQDAGRGAAQP